MKKYFLFLLVGLAGLGILTVFEYQRAGDGKLHVIFCNVGQGDGILIKSPSGKLVMVDAGPDESMLTCLSDNTAFWQHTIDLFILTHPHSDHFMGVFSVFPNYTVKSYVSEMLANRSVNFTELMKSLEKEGTKTGFVKRGNVIDLSDGVKLTVLAPSDSYLLKTSPGGVIGETEDNASLVILLSYGTFLALLSGDSEVSGMYVANPPNVDVLHVPHHGSRYGLDQAIVNQIDPEVAVISVGKNNYGHPTKEVLGILGDHRAKIYRTDEVDEIEIISDGTIFRVD